MIPAIDAALVCVRRGDRRRRCRRGRGVEDALVDRRRARAADSNRARTCGHPRAPPGGDDRPGPGRHDGRRPAPRASPSRVNGRPCPSAEEPSVARSRSARTTSACSVAAWCARRCCRSATCRATDASSPVGDHGEERDRIRSASAHGRLARHDRPPRRSDPADQSRAGRFDVAGIHRCRPVRRARRCCGRPSAVLWDGRRTWIELEGHGPDVEAERPRLERCRRHGTRRPVRRRCRPSDGRCDPAELRPLGRHAGCTTRDRSSRRSVSERCSRRSPGPPEPSRRRSETSAHG